MEIPRLENDEVAFAHPLSTPSLARNSGQTIFTVSANGADSTATENLVSDGEHLVHPLVGYLDPNLDIAALFHAGEQFLVYDFLTASSQ